MTDSLKNWKKYKQTLKNKMVSIMWTNAAYI